MDKKFTPQAWEDYEHWQEVDMKILARINELFKSISRDPYKGIGKPEPLKENLSGYWSRRITDEHRLVYRIETVVDPKTKAKTQTLVIVQARYHYK
jgi:toxin YoeB